MSQQRKSSDDVQLLGGLRVQPRLLRQHQLPAMPQECILCWGEILHKLHCKRRVACAELQSRFVLLLSWIQWNCKRQMPNLQRRFVVLDGDQQRVPLESDICLWRFKSHGLLLLGRVPHNQLGGVCSMLKRHILQGERLRETHI